MTMNEHIILRHIIIYFEMKTCACAVPVNLIKSLEFRFRKSTKEKCVIVIVVLNFFLFGCKQKINEYENQIVSLRSVDLLTALMQAHNAMNEILSTDIDIISFVELSHYTRIYKIYFYPMIQATNITFKTSRPSDGMFWSGTCNIRFHKMTS